jgi:LysM repeat protein
LKTNLLFLLPLCLIAKFAFAQTYYPPTATKTDSILTYKDTLFLQADASGQLSLIHRLKRGQTLFQLSDFFKVSVEDLRKANPQFAKGTANAAGQTINIPVTKEHLVRKKSTGFSFRQHLRVLYRVKQNETVYRIAKTYLDMPVDTLLARNRTKTESVSPNSTLNIGWVPLSGIKVSAPAVVDTTAAAAPPAPAAPVISETLRRALITSEKQKEKFLEMGLIQKDIVQKGVAYWSKEDTRLVRTNTSFFALHNDAAIGSTVKVYNPMYRRTLYMKVIGRIPKAGYTPDITIVLSPYAAKTLGAVDTRFHIEVTYLK